MKVVELVSIGRELLKRASENEVRVDDWKYLSLYEEYTRMREKGVKYRYAVAHVANHYNISKSKVERIIRRFGRDC
jgi:hypothetical protein